MSHGWYTCNVGGCNCHYHEAEEVDGGCPRCHLTTTKIVELFPKKPVDHTISKLDFWKGRNEIISRDFHTFSVFQKQETLDTVLTINNQLYELVLKLKGELD